MIVAVVRAHPCGLSFRPVNLQVPGSRTPVRTSRALASSLSPHHLCGLFPAVNLQTQWHPSSPARFEPVSRNPPYSRYLFQINVPTLRSFFHTFNLWQHLACRRQFNHASRVCAHDCREAGNRTPSQCNAWHIRKNKNRGFQLIS